VSPSRSRSGGQGDKRGSGDKRGGGGSGSGGKGRSRAKQNRSGKPRSGKQNRPRKPAADRNRPFWANAEAEAEVQRAIELVRPAHDPTAVVRSLGSPPLGRFADNAHPVYALVYQRAQRLAVTMATANGLLVVDEADGDARGEGDS
jgi:hypothetical protein